jgi:hypothetical protein
MRACGYDETPGVDITPSGVSPSIQSSSSSRKRIRRREQMLSVKQDLSLYLGQLKSAVSLLCPYLMHSRNKPNLPDASQRKRTPKSAMVDARFALSTGCPASR